MWTPLFNLFEKNFVFLLILFWSAQNIAQLLFLVAIFQQKEYRWDRLRVHLTTYEGRKLFINLVSLLKWALLLSAVFLLFSEKYRLLFPYEVIIFYIFEVFSFIKSKLDLAYKRPAFSLRALLLVSLVLIFQAAAVGLFLMRFGLGLAVFTLILDKVLPLLILLANLVSLPLVKILKKKTIFQAKRKIQDFGDFTVIGITGSYGKTSTKYFLAKILSSKYKVFYAQGSNNTDIGIAAEILKSLSENHEIFIVEMGAYKRGEIKAICDMVKPKIGIITATGDQHLALFGSRENIVKTKFELLDSLAHDGLAVLNGDDEGIVKKAAEYALKKVFWSLSEGGDAYTTATNAILGKKHIRFKVVNHGEEAEFQVGVLGLHNVANILATVAVASSLNLSLSDIAKAARKIVPPPHTLEPVRGLNESFLIDDTFNASPEGVAAALKYLDSTDWKKKILVMQPMIELGEKAKEEHIKLGVLVGNVCDFVYFTNQDYRDFIQTGYKRSKKRALLLWGRNRKKIAKELLVEVSAKEAVLFEGKQAAAVLKLLRKK